MTGPEVAKLADEMAKLVAKRTDDSAGQMSEMRRIAEAMRLSAIRISWNKRLDLSCWAVMDEARKQGRSVEQVRAALVG